MTEHTEARTAQRGACTVEVVVVSYNTREILADTLRTLLDHPSPARVRLSVTVVDNASGDGSADMVAREFPGVNLIRLGSNVGFGEANNIVARGSTADYLLLLNSDVVVTEDIVGPLVEELERDPRALLAGPRLVFPNGAVQYSAQAFPSLGFEYALVLRGTRLGRLLTPMFDSEARARQVWQRALTESRADDRRPDFIWATCWLVRTAHARDLGLFGADFPMYDEDLDFCRRAREAGWMLRYVPSIQLTHLGGASSTSTAKARLMMRARRRYYRVHAGTAGEIAYRLGVAVLTRAVRLTAAVPRDWAGGVRGARDPRL